MKARAFRYARPGTIAEALETFAAADGEASYIAGGQSLVPALALRLQAPSLLIDIGHIEEFRGVCVAGGALRIGALTRHAEMLSDPLIARHAPLLREAAAHVAHPAIRNRGTLGGSVALADPSAEFPAMMLALAAEIEIAGSQGHRRVAADDFFLDFYQTALEPGELVVALHVPLLRAGQLCSFDEFARRRGDYALVGAGIVATLDQGSVAGILIAFLSVAPTPVRAKAAEAALMGSSLNDAAIRDAQTALSGDIDPPDDAQVPAAMRLHLARVLLGRLLGRIREAA